MRLYSAFLRFAFHLFYNPFAFTYDFVSALVSRGHWRAWTRATIPFIVGKRVLEIPCGTGNLLLDLRAAGYAAMGVDLSAAMLDITRGKFRRAARSERHPERSAAKSKEAESKNAPILRARVQQLPLPNGAFDSITLTFPPGFARDPRAFAELRRVLADDGRLIWVDAARLLLRDGISRALNAALDAVGGSGAPFEDFAREVLARAGFESKIERIQDDASVVTVIIATKEQAG
ncbi:MAG: class I SAM-dependent methyltransferase [Chloroflexota bacterium]